MRHGIALSVESTRNLMIEVWFWKPRNAMRSSRLPHGCLHHCRAVAASLQSAHFLLHSRGLSLFSRRRLHRSPGAVSPLQHIRYARPGARRSHPARGYPYRYRGVTSPFRCVRSWWPGQCGIIFCIDIAASRQQILRPAHITFGGRLQEGPCQSAAVLH